MNIRHLSKQHWSEEHPSATLETGIIDTFLGTVYAAALGKETLFLAPYTSKKTLKEAEAALVKRIPHKDTKPLSMANERKITNAINATVDGKEVKIDLLMIGTDFQFSVWKELVEIPRSSACTYGHIAETIGRAKSARAVGQAVGANPVSILVPCHRVLPAAGGTLGNYAWGVKLKETLLEHEELQAVAL